MVSDGRKGLQMSWNLLNLANSAAMYGGSLTYVWLSDGTKVGAKADDGSGNGTQKRYLGSYVFTSTDGSSTAAPTAVESIAWDEGRINCGGSAAQDCWFAGDHLGNVRSVIDITASLTTPQILEQNDYLPYGTKIQNPDHASQSGNRWRYAAKEEQRYGSLDLSLLDFGARMYDPFIARWTAVDPLALISGCISTYNYCGGNPVRFIDLFGLWRKTSDGSDLEEEGDTVESFASTYDMSVEDAQRYLDQNGYIAFDGSFCLPVSFVSAERGTGTTPYLYSSLTIADWGLPSNPNLSYRMRTNKKLISITVYDSGWMKGNQHVAKKYLHSTETLSSIKRRILRPMGNAVSIYSASLSLQKALEATDSVTQFEYIIDAVMDCSSVIPTWQTQALSLYYNMGGKEVTKYYLDYTSKMIQSNPYYRPYGIY